MKCIQMISGGDSRGRVLAVLLGLFLIACGGLPGDFESLSAVDKIHAYEEHLEAGGRPLPHARQEIAWHGREAAYLLSDYLTGSEAGLPTLEAIRIIESVQLGGCSLKGTKAEAALEEARANAPADSLERIAVESALDSIRRDIVLSGPDAFEDGPCAAEAPS
jgi:hypothetical protein